MLFLFFSFFFFREIVIGKPKTKREVLSLLAIFRTNQRKQTYSSFIYFHQKRNVKKKQQQSNECVSIFKEAKKHSFLNFHFYDFVVFNKMSC